MADALGGGQVQSGRQRPHAPLYIRDPRRGIPCTLPGSALHLVLGPLHCSLDASELEAQFVERGCHLCHRPAGLRLGVLDLGEAVTQLLHPCLHRLV